MHTPIVELAPHQAVLVQAMRNIGYTLETALADNRRTRFRSIGG